MSRRLPIFVWLFFSTTFFSFGQSTHYFIAPNGNDEAVGTQEKPFATGAPRMLFSGQKQQQGHLVDTTIVWFREGVYVMDVSFVADDQKRVRIFTPAGITEW